MAVRPILTYGDPRLHSIAKPVEVIDEEIQELIDDMFETMFIADGLGLAATQIGVEKSIIVLHLDNDKAEAKMKAFINLEILDVSGSCEFEEGCLSVPGINAEVERPEDINVRYITREGDIVEENITGLLARVLQHEYDHLQGILFVQKVDPAIKKALQPMLRKLTRNVEV